MYELGITGCKAGWEPKDFASLAHSEEKCRQVLSFLRGGSEIKETENIIDMDANPYLPNGWNVEEHRRGGLLKWDPTKVKFRLSKNQQGDKRIVGNELRKELVKQPVLNANMLDYLYAKQELIPEEWKRNQDGSIRYTFFWGTIYRNSAGSLFVRCLCFIDGQWFWVCRWLGHDWGSHDPAAVSAS